MSDAGEEEKSKNVSGDVRGRGLRRGECRSVLLLHNSPNGRRGHTHIPHESCLVATAILSRSTRLSSDLLWYPVTHHSTPLSTAGAAGTTHNLPCSELWCFFVVVFFVVLFLLPDHRLRLRISILFLIRSACVICYNSLRCPLVARRAYPCVCRSRSDIVDSFPTRLGRRAGNYRSAAQPVLRRRYLRARPPVRHPGRDREDDVNRRLPDQQQQQQPVDAGSRTFFVVLRVELHSHSPLYSVTCISHSKTTVGSIKRQFLTSWHRHQSLPFSPQRQLLFYTDDSRSTEWAARSDTSLFLWLRAVYSGCKSPVHVRVRHGSVAVIAHSTAVPSAHPAATRPPPPRSSSGSSNSSSTTEE